MQSYGDTKRPQLNLEDLLHLRWLLGGGMSLLSVWTLFYLEAAIWPVALLATAAILVAMAFPALPGRVPRTAWHLGMPSIAIVFAVDIYSGEMIPAFVRLTVLLVLYRAVSHRARREDLQLVVLCLFLIVVTGVLTVSMVFVAQIFAFAAFAMGFLFVVNLVRDAQGAEPITSSDWALISRKRLLKRLWRAVDMRLAVLGAAMLAAVVVISTLIFLVIPRFQMDGTISLFQSQRARSVSGFSENIALGEVTEITQNTAIAMRVDVEKGTERPTVPYWRMVTLDEYGAGAFRVSRAVQARVGARSIEVSSLVPDWGGAVAFPAQADQSPGGRYTVFLEGGVSRYLPLPGVFQRVRFKEGEEIVPNPVFKIFATPRQKAGLMIFQIEGADFSGVIPDPEFATLNLRAPSGSHAEDDESDDRFRYRFLSYPATTTALPVPPEERAYLVRVVEEITQGRTMDAATFAAQACEYLTRQHRYALTVSLPGGEGAEDPVVRWLQADLPGHCEFFAASFTLLSRAAGFPTRTVTGFKGGAWNAYEHYYMVRHSDAHAWCEVYDSKGAWFRVDPTAGSAGVGNVASVEEAIAAVAGDRSLSAYMDSLRMLWYRRIVSFDKRSQQEVIGSIRGAGRTLTQQIAALVTGTWREFETWMRSPWTFRSGGDFLYVAVVMAVVAYIVRRSGVRTSDLLGWMERGEAGTRRRAGLLLRRLQLQLAEPHRRRRDWDVGHARRLETDLVTIRYGRPESWPETWRAFRAVRRIL